jgi:catechol 2,3-dioxygenase
MSVPICPVGDASRILAVTGSLQLEVAHAVLYVHDMEQMVAFYCDTLGFEVTDRGPLRGEEIVFLSQTANAHHQLALVTGRSTPVASDNLHHVAFRSGGTLDDLRALNSTLQSNHRITQIMPLTHGNAWSVYFRDPEFNGVEVFIDTPWHVRQPQGEPLDLARSNQEIVEWTHAHYANEPEFGPMDEFFRRRAQHLKKVS